MRSSIYIKGSIIFLVILLLSLSGIDSNASDPFTQMGVIKPRISMKAPEFSLPDIKGNMVSPLTSYNGRVIILNFWASWCSPCREEMPGLEALWKKFRDKGLVVIGVSVDRGNINRVKEFIRDMGIDFPILRDSDGAVRNAYEVFALPMTYIIGRDGKIIGRIPGERNWDSEDGNRLIELLLPSFSP